MAFRGFHGDDAHITFFIKKGEEESSDLSVMAGSLAKILFLWYITKLRYPPVSMHTRLHYRRM